ncbi:Hypothetical protein NGAL_HAMBI1146_58650 [Neorhizobium galegae bv. officinalis]|nr:Hypothetical protein NGAL_HAMBI1146_58650 [Neorhizobium galegae bv. officinalis]
MSAKLVTEAGFYNGRFLKAGQHYQTEGEASEVSDKLSKDELLSIAGKRGVEVDATKTKAEIIAAIQAVDAK